MFLQELIRRISFIKINNCSKLHLYRLGLLQVEGGHMISTHLFWPVEELKIPITLFTMIKPVNLWPITTLTHVIYKIDQITTLAIQEICLNQMLQQFITTLKTNFKTDKPWLREITNSKPLLIEFWTFQEQYLMPLRLPRTILKWAQTLIETVILSSGLIPK